MLWKYDTSSFVLKFRWRFFCSDCFAFWSPSFPHPYWSKWLLLQKRALFVTESGKAVTWAHDLHVPPPYLRTKHRNQSISVLRTAYLPHWSIIYKFSGAKGGLWGLTNHCIFSLTAFLHFHLAIEELFLSCFPAELKTNRLLYTCNMV